MTFCCRGFEWHFGYAGARGFSVLSVGKFYKDETAFFLQHRALDIGAEPPAFAPSPLSLVSDLVIQFCPWCGTKLEEFYGASPEIMRSDLKIC